jgi:hypothetical protein
LGFFHILFCLATKTANRVATPIPTTTTISKTGKPELPRAASCPDTKTFATQNIKTNSQTQNEYWEYCVSTAGEIRVKLNFGFLNLSLLEAVEVNPRL